MSQQINLYQPIFRKQKRKFSAAAMLQATALIVVGAGLLYGYTFWQVRQLRAEAAQTDRQFAALSKRLDDTTRQFREQLQSKALQERIRQFEAQVAEKQRLQEVLGSAHFNTVGFSEYFIAFARQHTPGVWITSLEITGAAERLTLAGRSTNPELVPRYLQRLSAEKRLHGIEFRSFQMSRPGADGKGAPAAFVEFVARTGAAGEPALEAAEATP